MYYCKVRWPLLDVSLSSNFPTGLDDMKEAVEANMGKMDEMEKAMDASKVAAVANKRIKDLERRVAQLVAANKRLANGKGSLQKGEPAAGSKVSGPVRTLLLTFG